MLLVPVDGFVLLLVLLLFGFRLFDRVVRVSLLVVCLSVRSCDLTCVPLLDPTVLLRLPTVVLIVLTVRGVWSFRLLTSPCAVRISELVPPWVLMSLRNPWLLL